MLVNPANATNTETTLRDVEPAARAMGLQIQVLNASTSREIDAAFATIVRERPDALFVGDDAFFNSRRVQLVHLATRHGVPATYSDREYAEVGGLMSYGSNITDAYRQVGVYAGRILKGAKPADLPVVHIRYSPNVNLKPAIVAAGFILMLMLTRRRGTASVAGKDPDRPRHQGLSRPCECHKPDMRIGRRRSEDDRERKPAGCVHD